MLLRIMPLQLHVNTLSDCSRFQPGKNNRDTGAHTNHTVIRPLTPAYNPLPPVPVISPSTSKQKILPVISPYDPSFIMDPVLNSLTYFLVSSYRSALCALSKCNLGSMSSFLKYSPAAKHILQRNMKEYSRRGLQQTQRNRPVSRKSLETIANVSFLISSCFNGPKLSSVLWLHG